MSWIECNLPWDKYYRQECPEYPYSLDDEMDEIFGIDHNMYDTTLFNELERKHFPNFQKQIDEISSENISELEQLKKIGKLEFQQTLFILDEYSHLKKISCLRDYFVREHMKSEWKYSNPKYINYVNICERQKKDYDEMETFCGNNLNQPGTLIDIDSEILLIGHINPHNMCNLGAKVIKNETIVKRYKIIWKSS